MADTHPITSLLHYENRREYTVKRGNIAYLDGTPLKRPFSMPTAQRVIALVIVIAAMIIGFFLINRFILEPQKEAAAVEETIASNVARQPSIETIPRVAPIITMDNDSILGAINNANYKYIDVSPQDGSNDLVIYKIPSDMSVEDASALYTKGLGSLSAADASKLMTGAWYLSADRVNGTSVVVRYVDFSTSDPQIAVQNAMAKQGIDQASVSESGVDESGNTFCSGTLDAEGTMCSWKISALKLDEMYSISGLPDACYVGVRVTAL